MLEKPPLPIPSEPVTRIKYPQLRPQIHRTLPAQQRLTWSCSHWYLDRLSGAGSSGTDRNPVVPAAEGREAATAGNVSLAWQRTKRGIPLLNCAHVLITRSCARSLPCRRPDLWECSCRACPWSA